VLARRGRAHRAARGLGRLRGKKRATDERRLVLHKHTRQKAKSAKAPCFESASEAGMEFVRVEHKVRGARLLRERYADRRAIQTMSSPPAYGVMSNQP
jgi:hypothetical protein